MMDKDKLVGRIQSAISMSGKVSSDNSATLSAQVSVTGRSTCNYGIVENQSLLPTYFKPNERAMYFSIEDGYFFLWDGTQWTDEMSDLTDEQMATLKSIIND